MLYLSLGSNLGDRAKNIESAYRLIEKKIGLIVQKSSIWESEPWGYASFHYFYNTVCMVDSHISDMHQLLKEIRKIEATLGRTRSKSNQYEDRTIDIDILSINNTIVANNNLCIPHPKMHLRKFVLLPLNEISPEWKHPNLNKSVSELLEECSDLTKVTKLII